MSYKEPDYHKEGDLPFTFPPKGITPSINANLVEIEGKNGSGKTTLLNCLALSLGYLDQEKELGNKPALKKKLEALEDNNSLEYDFRVCCDKPEAIDLRVQRIQGQRSKFWLNSKQIAGEDITKRFEVIFLTEDDPTKVVNSSLGKLRKYFLEMEKNLGNIQDALFKNLQDISDYRNFERKEKKFLDEIAEANDKIKEGKQQYQELKILAEKLQKKEEVFAKLQLHKNEQKITNDYRALETKLSALEGKTDASILKKLDKERWNLRNAKSDITSINSRIVQICSSLGNYGQHIDAQKLLDNDHSELNELNRKIAPEKQKEEVKLQMVEEMITLFKHYQESDVIPIINMSVHQAVKELFTIQAKAASERIFALIGVLNKAIDERNEKLREIVKINQRTTELTEKSKELEGIQKLKEEFQEIQEKYLNLQLALKTPRSQLLNDWNDLRDIEGDVNSTKTKMESVSISTGTNEKLKEKQIDGLNLLKESNCTVPLYEKEEAKIKALYEKMTLLRENTFHWSQILQDPIAAKSAFVEIGDRQGFGLKDFKIFVQSIGEYLGNQFEPVAYDYKLHNIHFFDIENNTFTTSENRKIAIDQLSQGQSKITTLTGSFKKMDTARKKIVLIDEIADLDPENLQSVKNMLKEKLDEGSLILAVLVRPPHRPLTEVIEVRGWE